MKLNYVQLLSVCLMLLCSCATGSQGVFQVTVSGDVVNPGGRPFKYSRDLSVGEIIASAGGIAPEERGKRSCFSSTGP
jgi:hypothetical protein